MTELGSAAFTSYETETMEQMTGTVGMVSDHMEVNIVDRQGRTVPMGTPGELCVRGYGRMIRYYKDEEKSKEMFTENGWLKTG